MTRDHHYYQQRESWRRGIGHAVAGCWSYRRHPAREICCGQTNGGASEVLVSACQDNESERLDSAVCWPKFNLGSGFCNRNRKTYPYLYATLLGLQDLDAIVSVVELFNQDEATHAASRAC
jgi:hypothetical protein